MEKCEFNWPHVVETSTVSTCKHDKSVFQSYLFRNIPVMWPPLVYKLWRSCTHAHKRPIHSIETGSVDTFKPSSSKRVKSTKLSLYKVKKTSVALSTVAKGDECRCVEASESFGRDSVSCCHETKVPSKRWSYVDENDKKPQCPYCHGHTNGDNDTQSVKISITFPKM